MGDENLNPLEELKRLDQQVGLVASLEALKPIYYRLDEIAKKYPNDFEVQLVVGDIKQHLVNRGTKLKEQEATIATAPVQAPPTPPAPPAEPPAPPPTARQKIVIPPAPVAVPPPIPTPPSIPAAAPPPPIPAPSPESPIPSRQFAVPPMPTAAFPSTGQQAVPPIPPVGPPPMQPPVAAAPPPSGGPAKPVAWKKALIAGAILGMVVALAGIALLVNMARRHRAEQAGASIQVQVATTPPGAAIKVNGEDKCNSPCSIPLPPGDYQVTASLPGYEPGAGGVTVPATGAPPALNLTLEASPQPMRILADGLDGSKVIMDDQPAGEVQQGQFFLDNVKPGPHTVKITGKAGEATFAFETAEAKLPNVTGATGKGLLTVAVASFGNAAKLTASAGPLKLALNGQPQADASPAGVDLQGFQAGPAEIKVGEGATEKTLQDTFGPNPGLTVFIRSEKAGPPAPGDFGAVVVVTGEDDVHVFINNREQPRHTVRGQLRIPVLPGRVNVRVAKDGFNAPAAQTVNVAKGADTRVEFQLQKIETKLTPIAPPAPVNTAPASGTVRIARSTGGATTTYRRDTDNQPHLLNGSQIDLAPGNYIFVSKAPGYVDKVERVQVVAGGQVSIDLTLNAVRAAAPAARVGGMADWEDPSGWTRDGETWVHKGGNFVAYKLPAKGVYTFTVELIKGGGLFRGGHIRWYVDYTDPKNYGLFEIDKKTFWAKTVVNGKSKDREKTQHGLENQKTFTIQVDVAPEHVVTRIKNGDTWITLDSWTEAGRNFSDGKFGFYIPGNDEIGITDFRFQPK